MRIHLFATAFALALTVIAASTVGAKELKGHSLFPTPDGFEIKKVIKSAEYGTFDNNESTYACSKVPCTSKAESTISDRGQIKAAGKVTQLEYKIAGGKNFSRLQIIKSYEAVIKQLGGTRITDEREGVANLFVIKTPNSKMLVDVYPANNDSYYLTVIEEGGFVQIVTAGQLSEQIDKQGFANLNVNFDTNKAVVKDADKAAISEVIVLLKSDLKLRLSIEGHTDNVGALAANKSLSQARSESLVAYIVAGGVQANRLVAKGIGSEVPVADNRSEEGRAKNRRVELVKIK